MHNIVVHFYKKVLKKAYLGHNPLINPLIREGGKIRKCSVTVFLTNSHQKSKETTLLHNIKGEWLLTTILAYAIN